MESNSAIRTYTGRTLDLLNPLIHQISIIDIAHGLSTESRFSNQLKNACTVAEHSIHVSRLIFRETESYHDAMTGLLHDASEAYIRDLPSPLKAHLPQYQLIESRLQKTIYNAFGLLSPSKEAHERLKRIDISRREYERCHVPSWPSGPAVNCLFLEEFLTLESKI